MTLARLLELAVQEQTNQRAFNLEIVGKLQEEIDFKEYVALISQEESGAPSAVVLKNTLGGAVVWTRDDPGVFLATLAGAFPANRTTILINPGVDGVLVNGKRASDNVIQVTTKAESEGSFVESDDSLSAATIVIRVYPLSD